MSRRHALSGLVLSAALACAPLCGSPVAAQTGTEGVPTRFNIDPAHSDVSFTVRHLGLSRVRGTFSTVSGSLLWDADDPTRSSLSMLVRTESLNTGNTSRDQDLRDNYFEVEEHPVALFRSTAVRESGPDGLVIEGDLTIKGVTERVSFGAERLGDWQDPDSRSSRVGFAGAFQIDRNVFGVNNPGSAAEIDLVIADEVQLRLELEGVRNDPAGIAFAGQEQPSIGERLDEPLRAGEFGRAQTLFSRARDNGDLNLGQREFLVLCVQLLWDEMYPATAAAARMGPELHPESTTLKSLLAEALLRSGETAEARSILDGILEGDPTDPTALELLRHASR